MFDIHQPTHLVDVDVCQEVASATHLLQMEIVHDLAFGRFFVKLFGQVHDLVNVLALHARLFSQFAFAHFGLIIAVFVGKHVATSKTFDGDDHGFTYYLTILCSDGFK